MGHLSKGALENWRKSLKWYQRVGYVLGAIFCALMMAGACAVGMYMFALALQ